MMEAEAGVMLLEDRGRGHKPRNTGGHQKLKKARTANLTDYSIRNQSC